MKNLFMAKFATDIRLFFFFFVYSTFFVIFFFRKWTAIFQPMYWQFNVTIVKLRQFLLSIPSEMRKMGMHRASHHQQPQINFHWMHKNTLTLEASGGVRYRMFQAHFTWFFFIQHGMQNRKGHGKIVGKHTKSVLYPCWVENFGINKLVFGFADKIALCACERFSNRPQNSFKQMLLTWPEQKCSCHRKHHQTRMAVTKVKLKAAKHRYHNLI